MTVNSAPAARRKPSLLWLAIPWGLVITAAVVWSGLWLWTAHQIGPRLDAAAAGLRAAGWQASWTSRKISGYPFRLDVDVAGLTLADPSGWAVAAPTLKSEAYLFAPTRWLIAAPDGLTLTRPGGDGAVDIGARRLRFSLNSWDEHPPRLSLEGDDVTFTPAPGARPFALSRADDVQFYTRAGPDDQGAMLLKVDGGAASPGDWLAPVAGGKPLAITLDMIFNHASQLQGPTLRDAALRWAHAGGVFTVQQVSVGSFEARAGHLTVGDDGRLAGDLAPALARLADPAAGRPPRLF